ncbi:MAG: hypothetical protein HY552_05955 [Elusimicrobia bacterium]|nr:hypothetical protein [Elusimicrobiota bacterium]
MEMRLTLPLLVAAALVSAPHPAGAQGGAARQAVETVPEIGTYSVPLGPWEAPIDSFLQKYSLDDLGLPPQVAAALSGSALSASDKFALLTPAIQRLAGPLEVSPGMFARSRQRPFLFALAARDVPGDLMRRVRAAKARADLLAALPSLSPAQHRELLDLAATLHRLRESHRGWLPETESAEAQNIHQRISDQARYIAEGLADSPVAAIEPPSANDSWSHRAHAGRDALGRFIALLDRDGNGLIARTPPELGLFQALRRRDALFRLLALRTLGEDVLAAWPEHDDLAAQAAAWSRALPELIRAGREAARNPALRDELREIHDRHARPSPKPADSETVREHLQALERHAAVFQACALLLPEDPELRHWNEEVAQGLHTLRSTLKARRLMARAKANRARQDYPVPYTLDAPVLARQDNNFDWLQRMAYTLASPPQPLDPATEAALKTLADRAADLALADPDGAAMGLLRGQRNRLAGLGWIIARFARFHPDHADLQQWRRVADRKLQRARADYAGAQARRAEVGAPAFNAARAAAAAPRLAQTQEDFAALAAPGRHAELEELLTALTRRERASMAAALVETFNPQTAPILIALAGRIANPRFRSTLAARMLRKLEEASLQTDGADTRRAARDVYHAINDMGAE